MKNDPSSTDQTDFRRLHAYFLSNISHEFKTPLASLGASLELLLDELDDLSPTEQRELLRSVQLSVGSLQTLVNNLLESTTIEAGQLQFISAPWRSIPYWPRRCGSFNRCSTGAIRI